MNAELHLWKDKTILVSLFANSLLKLACYLDISTATTDIRNPLQLLFYVSINQLVVQPVLHANSLNDFTSYFNDAEHRWWTKLFDLRHDENFNLQFLLIFLSFNPYAHCIFDASQTKLENAFQVDTTKANLRRLKKLNEAIKL